MQLSRLHIIVLTSVFIAIFDNYRFFSNVIKVYPVAAGNGPFLFSIFVVLCAFMVLLFSLVCTRTTLKPILIISLIIASLLAYFADSFSTIIDTTMIQNTLETDQREVFDLLTVKLFFYLGLLGILPALVIYRISLSTQGLKQYLRSTALTSLTALAIIVVCLFSFSKAYTSFFREHKPLRYYTNPTYAYYSAGNFIAKALEAPPTGLTRIGLDAHQQESDQADRRLAILVVGEAARADHFSLNGYTAETNPLLKEENIINLSNVYSCGTSTAVSVPCMFSLLERDNYNDRQARSTENVLDVLARAGINVLWRDNNSGSKGVADRIPFENFSSPKINKVCDPECRDIGMLDGLQEYVGQKKGDILIVLHQMGNHGPAYYRRYPQNFKAFTPVCETNQLEQCRQEEISNAYDNAIRYTDNFLSRVITFLKKNSTRFQTTLIYMSDHGESLGEGGLYLHGLPYFIAPKAQKHVGALLWFGGKPNQDIGEQQIRQDNRREFSHDNLFHTLLGLMRVRTDVYNPAQDILLHR